MTLDKANTINLDYAKTSEKTLKQQVSVVAEFHAHKIAPQRIAYRTGIAFDLVTQLINGESHQRLFTLFLARHRKARRDQRLHKSLRKKGIAQSELQNKIEVEYKDSMQKKTIN
jgi:hypothetical protein